MLVITWARVRRYRSYISASGSEFDIQIVERVERLWSPCDASLGTLHQQFDTAVDQSVTESTPPFSIRNLPRLVSSLLLQFLALVRQP